MPEILKELYRDKVYDKYLADKSDLTILDIGANIGLCTYYFSPFAKQVISIEPATEHFETLNKMVEFNKLDNVKTVNAALGTEDGVQTFYHNTNTTMYSLMPAVKDQDTTEDVEVIRFDTLFERMGLKHVDFIKLDVEGSECEILAGEGFDNVADKIDMILGEWHVWSMTGLDQLLNNLRDHGFEAEQISHDGAKLFYAKRN